MRDGFKIFDTDTHIRPSAESIRPFLSQKVLDRIPDLEEHRVSIKVGMAGEVRTEPYRHWYRFRSPSGGGWGSNKPRYLGEAGPREGDERDFQTFMGSRFPTEGGGDYAPELRLKDMDEEGTDAHFIVHTGGANHPDTDLEMEFIRAEHRYLDHFCGADPHRLKSCVTITPTDVEGSIEEIKRWGPTDWCVAVHPKLPLDFPLDHPDLNPVWAAAQEQNLAVIHHSFAGYPAYRDLWDNPFMGRLAGHPWGAMRAVASFFGSGIMDRFPYIRYGVLESGFGWLPFWAKRMDDQAIYMGYVAENLEYKLSEYMTSGRFFAAIVLHEGEDMVKMVDDLLGDHVLTYGSDYPHSESRFPESASIPVSWGSLTPERKRKLLWDNPVRFFGEP